MKCDNTNHTQVQRGVMKVFQWFIFVYCLDNEVINSNSFIVSNSYLLTMFHTLHKCQQFAIGSPFLLHIKSINTLLLHTHSSSLSSYHSSLRESVDSWVCWYESEVLIECMDGVSDWMMKTRCVEWEIIRDDTQFIFKS